MAAENRGFLPTALGLLVLGVAGFGVGVVAGGFWEEPDLVAHHLLGGTEAVSLAFQGESPLPAEGLTPVAAAPVAAPAVESRASVKRVPRVPAPPLPTSPAVSSAPPASRAAVQVGAFAESRVAEQLASRLRAKGYQVYLSPGAGSGDARWRVRVGPLDSREAAQRTAARLKTEEKLPTWVLSE